MLEGAPRTNIDSLDCRPRPSSSGYRNYASGKGLLHRPLESDYQDGILSHVHPGISMGDERTVDCISYRRELDLRDEEHQGSFVGKRKGAGSRARAMRP